LTIPINTDSRLTAQCYSFPPVRAIIFDLDGLLINTEDVNAICTNNILTKYGRPTLPRSIQAQLLGVFNASLSEVLYNWAQLPITREQLASEQMEQKRLHLPKCKPLPGAEKLLSDLKNARSLAKGNVEIALATSSTKYKYDLKMQCPEIERLLNVFPKDRLVLGDDPRVKHGRAKPAPDIYLVALQTINSSFEGSDKMILPEECLVLEDSVPGVEAGRRAGMRVIWVPHPVLAAEYKGREKEVLAGRTGLAEIGDNWQLGEIDDGWAEQLPNLEAFPFEKYGIEISKGRSSGEVSEHS
jgi:pseudouridine-5'-monophosphatase